MIDMTDGPDVYVRLAAIEFFFGHLNRPSGPDSRP
jgi:hypothetical protein